LTEKAPYKFESVFLQQRVERTSHYVCGDPELRGKRGIQAAGSAILAADMVGYSRLMGLDEAGTVASST
jgi:hypothetical protein